LMAPDEVSLAGGNCSCIASEGDRSPTATGRARVYTQGMSGS
jgi:hypothetical protein